MFCPKCGDEYREGFTVCATCMVPLVKDPPLQVEPEFGRFVTVYETANAVSIAFVKSLFESEGVEYHCKGEGSQYPLPVLPVQFQVNEKDAEKAREILNQIEENNFELVESDVKNVYAKEIEDKATGKRTSGGLIKGIIIGIFISAILFVFYEYNQRHLSGVVKYDLNKDSKPDDFYYYKNGTLVNVEIDRNSDGKIDFWFFYKDGVRERGESDDDFDGVVDNRYYYKSGKLDRVEIDTNNDKEPEIVEYYKNEIMTQEWWYHESSRIIWKRVFFVKGIREEEYVDQDYDGAFDIRIVYNSSGRPIHIIQLEKTGVPKTKGRN